MFASCIYSYEWDQAWVSGSPAAERCAITGLAIHVLASLRAEISAAQRNTTTEPQPIQRLHTESRISFVRFADDDSKIVLGLDDGTLAIWTLEEALDGKVSGKKG